MSIFDRDLSIQRAALKAAGCEVIRAEKASGTRRDGRTELQVMLDFLRAGDTLVVTRIDRLALLLKGLQDIVHDLKVKRVALKATEQPIDTSTRYNHVFTAGIGCWSTILDDLRTCSSWMQIHLNPFTGDRLARSTGVKPNCRDATVFCRVI